MSTGSKGPLALLKQISRTKGMPPIMPAPPASSRAVNGAKVFIPAISRIHLLYPPHNAPGMSDFIRKSLPAFAKEFPYCEFLVQPAPKRWPEVKATYIGGEESIYVKKMCKNQVCKVLYLIIGRSCREGISARSWTDEEEVLQASGEWWAEECD
jgi:hypothetical protein